MIQALDSKSDVAKAFTNEIMSTIKEILKLNPLFKEQLQVRARPHWLTDWLIERTAQALAECLSDWLIEHLLTV